MKKKTESRHVALQRIKRQAAVDATDAKNGILILSPTSFDGLFGGHRFHIGMVGGEAEFTTSASYAFTHSRLANFDKAESLSRAELGLESA